MMRPATTRRVALWLACAAALGSAACVAPVSLEELPAAPIAVTYWSRLDALDRLELLSEPRPQRRGVATVEALGALLGAPPADPADLANRYPGHLGLLDPRTGQIEAIEAAPPGAIPLAWSSDHQRLLYSADRATGSWQIYEYDLQRREVRRVTHGERIHPRGDYGPDTRLVHTSWGQAGVSGLTLTVIGRRDADPLVLSRGRPIEEVRWSPRGDMIVIVVPEAQRRTRPGPAPRMLYAIDPDGLAEPRPLGRGRDPVFSADGEWIVYSAAVGESSRLRRMRPDGSGRVLIAPNSRRDERQPAFSPDGSLVVYTAEEQGLSRLFVRRIDGSGERMLVRDEVVARPIW